MQDLTALFRLLLQAIDERVARALSNIGVTGGSIDTAHLAGPVDAATLQGHAANYFVASSDVRVTADQAANVASIRTLGTGATQAAAGNHTHSALYQPLDGTLTALAGLTIAANNLILCTGPDAFSIGQLTDAYVAAANKDGTAVTASMRTLGTDALQAAAGNHTHTYLPLAGGTLTGNLGIGATSPPHPLTVDGIARFRTVGATRYRTDIWAEATGARQNAYDDTGSVYIPYFIGCSSFILAVGTAGNVVGLSISASGFMTTDGDFCVNGAVGSYRLMGATTADVIRWWWGADSAAEGGTNAGSDFVILRYSDAGAGLGTPIKITRSTGLITVASGISLTGGHLTMAAGQNIVLPTTTGAKIGTATNQLLGFFNATPVAQQTKAGHNNWAAVSDVVSALVNLGFFDAA